MTPGRIRRALPHGTHRSHVSGASLGSATAVEKSTAFRAPSQRMLVEWSLLLSPGHGHGKVRDR
jgi:hypothetical protein